MMIKMEQFIQEFHHLLEKHLPPFALLINFSIQICLSNTCPLGELIRHLADDHPNDLTTKQHTMIK